MRIALAAGLLVAGLAAGLASVAVHNTWWGLSLAVAASGATAYALPGGWTGRAAFALGWAAIAGVLALPRSEGDYLIAGNLNGYGLLGFGIVLLVTGLVTLPPPRGNLPRLPRMRG